MNAVTLPLAGTVRWVPALAAAAVAAALLWAGVSAHLKLACVVKDTPYLPLCDSAADTAQERQHALGERIARNPGDSWAWVRLVSAQDAAADTPVLQGAAVLAPHHANVLKRRAGEALQEGRLEEGVDLLMQLIRHRGNAEAAQGIARLATTPGGMDLLRPHLPQARRWLPATLNAMQALKIPPSHALPLVAESLRLGVLDEATRRRYMRALKASGAWLDAYGLWLAQHSNTVPLLYNGNFDAAFVVDGFDWEYTPVTRSRAGVIVNQLPIARRGLVLELEFTGRSFTTPVLRQHVFVPPGNYRLRGEYMASKLRSESGLAWKVVCTTTGAQAPARMEPMQDTGGLWKEASLAFTIPADCGPVASLQLEPTAAYEANAGIKGRVELDAISLVRIEN